MVLGRIPAESSLSRSGHVLWGKTARSMMGLPSGDEDGMEGSPEQTLPHS